MARRLTRNPHGAVLGGVAGGFADYFDVDPVLVRLGFILLCFVNGLGLIAYLVCWVIMPVRQGDSPSSGSEEPAPAERIVKEVRQAGEKVVEGLRGSNKDGRRGGLLAGVVLIILGLVFLVDRLPWLYWPHWVRFSSLWPIVLIALGVAMIVGARRGKST